MTTPIWLCGLLAAAFTCLTAAPVLAQDAIFASGFEPFGPANDAQAARFLTQATFGPNRAEIANLRAIGFDAWLSQQMALAPTLARPFLEAQETQGLATGQGQRIDRWFHSATLAPDQLRQRVAWALSQIMVVSDQPDNLANDWPGIAEFNDHLVRGAFGSYRALLEQVTLSPQMGKYLSHWRNRKSSSSTEPDENFAREILQLFSIGLVWRNPDFSPMAGPGGQPIPTYDQPVITELAQVFTGFGNRCPEPPGLCNTYTGLTTVFDSYAPMACFPLFHDLSSKQLLDLDPGPGVNRVTLPAGPACDPAPAVGSPLRQQCVDYCASDLAGTLDMIASHPNVAPFLSRQLIQKLVTSNPSGAYVQRVATVFTSSSGNLGETVKAILLDPEARAFDPAAPGFGQVPNFGKTREPLNRIIAMWRAFGAQPGQCTGACIDQSDPPAGLVELRMGVRDIRDHFNQRPYSAPSVFNFFAPDFQPPGPLTQGSLFAPEFQIIDETTVLTAANMLWNMVWSGYSSNDGSFGTTPTRNAWFPPAQIDALPTEAGALIEELNVRMLYGSMSGTFVTGNCPAGTGMKGALYRLLQCNMPGAQHRRKVLGAIHLILISPEYSVQR